MLRVSSGTLVVFAAIGIGVLSAGSAFADSTANLHTYRLIISNGAYGGSVGCPPNQTVTEAEFPPYPPSEKSVSPVGCASVATLTGVALSPDGSIAYATDSSTGRIIPIDTARFTAGTSFSTGGIGTVFIRVSPDDKYLVAGDVTSKIISVIDLRDTAVKAKIPDTDQPLDVAILPNSSTAYVVNLDGTVSEVSLSGTPHLTKTIHFPSPGCDAGSKPSIAADRTQILVSCSNDLWPINVSGNSFGTPIQVPGVGQLAVTPNGSTAYLTGQGGVTPIELATRRVLNTIPLQDAYGVAVSPDGKYVAIAEDVANASTVELVSTTTERVVDTFDSGGNGPAWLAFAPPSSSTNSYVSSTASTLVTPGQAFSSVGRTIENAAIAGGSVLFITFPAQIFNATFDENYDEIVGRWRRFRSRFREQRPNPSTRGTSAQTPDSQKELLIFGTVLVVGSIIGGFRDPHFGFNVASIANLIGTLASIVALIAVPTAAAIVYRKTLRKSTRMSPRALPAGLWIALFTVLVSRLTGFQPGYLYGIVCGVVFASELGKPEEGKAVLFESIGTLALSVLAWLVFIPVNAAALKTGSSFGTALVDDWLASMVVGALVGVAIGMIPLRFLPGGLVYQWDRRVWAVLELVSVFGVVAIMLNPSSGPAHPGAAPLVTAVVLFVLFGGASFAFRQYFARKKPPGADPDRVTAPTGVGGPR